MKVATKNLIGIIKGIVEDVETTLLDAYDVEVDFSSEIDEVQYYTSNALEDLENSKEEIESKLQELGELHDLLDEVMGDVYNQLDEINTTINALSKIDEALIELSDDARISKDWDTGIELPNDDDETSTEVEEDDSIN